MLLLGPQHGTEQCLLQHFLPLDAQGAFAVAGIAATDLHGASTAVPTPPWSFLKSLCLLIAAQLPSWVPPLCAGTMESRLEGDNTSWSAHLSQRERGGSQHPHGLLTALQRKSKLQSCISLCIISSCKVPVALVTRNNVYSFDQAKSPSGQGNKKIHGLSSRATPPVLGEEGLGDRRNWAGCYDHTILVSVHSLLLGALQSC